MKNIWIDRIMEKELSQACTEYPVITITGPRQSGKTSLVKKYCPDHNYTNLELPDIRHLAQSDPRAFFKTFPAPLIIDEIQRVPELLSYIQVFADKTEKRGQYILTGSHQFDLMSAVSQSLAGRTALLRLLPLSLEELINSGISYNRDEILLKGFMPRLHSEKIRTGTLYSEYFQNYIERDLRQMSEIRDLMQFEKFLKILAGRTGQLININSLSGDTGVSRQTITSWLSILEASFIIFRLPPWFENAGKRAIKSPKLYFTEPGLAAWLLDIETPKQMSRDPLLGNIFENMVIIEALKSRLNHGKKSNLYFFRDTRGHEIDLIFRIQRQNHPVEIKAAMTWNKEMHKGIRYFKKTFPDSLPGTVIYSGELESKTDSTHFVNFWNTAELVMKKF